LLFVLIAIGYFGRIGGYALQDPDEGRYAEIAREMVVSGDWLTPTLNHVKYFDKPPLLYWLVAASFQLFGMSEGASRLVSAVAGLVTVTITFLLGRSMFGRPAALAATLILATTPLFFLFTQAVTTDMLLTACMTATLGAVWMLHQTGRARWALAVAATAALGVLAKGLVAAVLPGFVALAFLLRRADWPGLRRLVSLGPVAVFLALATPWFVAMAWTNPEFTHYFFYTQHVERFATAAVGHPEGPFFYIPILLAGALPWTILVASLLWVRRSQPGRQEPRSPSHGYLLLWALSVLLFFSAARSKLPSYILPAFPALALLAGDYLTRARVDDGARAAVDRVGARVVHGFVWVGAALALLAIFLTPFAQQFADLFRRDRHDVDLVLRAVTAAGAGATVVGLLARRWAGRWPSSAPHRVAAIAACTGAFLFLAVAGRDVVKTSRDVGAAVREHHTAGDLLVSYRRLLHGLPFYTGLRHVQAGSYGELDFGSRYAPDSAEYFWPETAQVAEAWESSQRVFVVTSLKHEAELRAVLKPAPRVLARDADRVVLVNFALPCALPETTGLSSQLWRDRGSPTNGHAS